LPVTDTRPSLSQLAHNSSDQDTWAGPLSSTALYVEEYRYDLLGRVVFQRRGDTWSQLYYDVDGKSRVAASSEPQDRVYGR
jgi:hypothetical protein